MSSQTVARRYASALADVVIAQKEASEVSAELAEWEDLIAANPPLAEAFNNPTIPYDSKSRLLNELISRSKVRPTTANFLKVLLKNQRFADLPMVRKKLEQILDERAGVISAEVFSARPIADQVRAELEETLASLTQKRVRLSFQTDETLLGGIVTRIGSTIYDGSVRNQLSRLGEELAG